MIGTMGLVEELSFVVIPLLLLVLVLYFSWRGRRVSSGRLSFKGILAAFVLVMLPVIFGWKFVREFGGHWFLSHLRPEQVDSITIDRKNFADGANKASIVYALNDAQWFAPHHGGWGEPIDITIRLRSGEERRFQVALYRPQTGVVVDLSPPGKSSGPHAGYALSRRLVDVLKQSGIDLSR